MEKRKVAKRFMFHLIETQSPIYRYMDEFGVIHLTGPDYDFLYTPFGMISAKNVQFEYVCMEPEFSGLYNGIVLERNL